MFPIVGFRYEGARGASLCQFCFWDRGREALAGTSDHEWIEHCYYARGRTKSKTKRLAEAKKQGRNRYSSGTSDSTAIAPASAAPSYLPPSDNDWLEIAPASSHGLRRGHSGGGIASSHGNAAGPGWGGGVRDGSAGAASPHGPPLPLGTDRGSSRRLEHMQNGIERLAASMEPTRLANGDPTAALYSLASGFDAEQKQCVIPFSNEIIPAYTYQFVLSLCGPMSFASSSVSLFWFA